MRQNWSFQCMTGLSQTQPCTAEIPVAIAGPVHRRSHMSTDSKIGLTGLICSVIAQICVPSVRIQELCEIENLE